MRTITILLALLAIPLQAQVPDKNVVTDADYVVMANVRTTMSILEKDANGDEIITSGGQFEITESLKGGKKDMILDLRYEGGTIGDLSMQVSDVELVTPGDIVVLVASKGKIHAMHRPEGRQPLRIVPAKYTLSGTKWFTSTVPYYINPTNADKLPIATVLADVQTAAAGWRLQSGVSPMLTYQGQSTGTSVTRNGKNEIFFAGSLDVTWGARSYSWWRTSTGERIESDIVYNDVKRKFFASSIGGCVNGHYVDDIGIHEIGHLLGLGHSAVSGATMRTYTTFCSRIQITLAPDDLMGIRAIYK